MAQVSQPGTTASADLAAVTATALPEPMSGRDIPLPLRALILAWPLEYLVHPSGARCAYALVARVTQSDGSTALILTTTLEAPRPADVGGGYGPSDTVTAWLSDADSIVSWWAKDHNADGAFSDRLKRLVIRVVFPLKTCGRCAMINMPREGKQLRPDSLRGGTTMRDDLDSMMAELEFGDPSLDLTPAELARLDKIAAEAKAKREAVIVDSLEDQAMRA